MFLEIGDHPHTAEMYICNLFVAYFVFSPVNADKAIFLNFFFVLGTNTLDYDVHIYGFWLNLMDLQGLPGVLTCKKTARYVKKIILILENVSDVLLKLLNATPVEHPFPCRTMVHLLQTDV